MCGSCYISLGQHFRASLGWSWSGPPDSKPALQFLLHTQLLQGEAVSPESLDPWCPAQGQASGLVTHLVEPVQNNSAEPLIQKAELDFPGGTGDKNPFANAGYKGSIPGLGRFYMLWSK